jgi:hypothetical protein
MTSQGVPERQVVVSSGGLRMDGRSGWTSFESAGTTLLDVKAFDEEEEEEWEEEEWEEDDDWDDDDDDEDDDDEDDDDVEEEEWEEWEEGEEDEATARPSPRPSWK